MICPLCGSKSFQNYRNVSNIRCRSCKSNERARAVKLFLDRHVRLEFGQKVLHFAPEPQLGQFIAATVGAGYDAVDIDPERYQSNLGHPVRRMDLCADAKTLPDEYYDLVLHNHVMEHLPCNVTCVLQHLHRAIKPGGVHLFSIPILAGYHEENLDPQLSDSERVIRFGQADHLRRFGREDFGQNIGAVFGLDATYSLRSFFSEEELKAANIRESQWKCSGSSVFCIRK